MVKVTESKSWGPTKKSCHKKLLMWRIIALGLAVQKFIARLNFSKIMSYSKVKMLVPTKKSGQKEKLMRNIKAQALMVKTLLAWSEFQIELQKDRIMSMTDRSKTLCSSIFLLWGVNGQLYSTITQKDAH